MPLEFTENAEVQNAPTIYRPSTNPADGQELRENADAIAIASRIEAVAALGRRRRRRLRRSGLGIAAFTVVTMTIMFILLTLTGSVGPRPWLISLLTIQAIFFTGLIGGIAYGVRGRKDQSLVQAVEDLAAEECTAASGALIDVLTLDNAEAVGVAAAALTRLAGQWTEDDIADLSQSQRAHLRGIVCGHFSAVRAFTAQTRHERTALRIALCRTFARIGDESDLPALRQEARLPANSPDGIRVRDAARAAIPLLVARVAAKRVPDTLVRAASRPATDGPEQLLRAAAARAELDGDTLLRADDGEPAGKS